MSASLTEENVRRSGKVQGAGEPTQAGSIMLLFLTHRVGDIGDGIGYRICVKFCPGQKKGAFGGHTRVCSFRCADGGIMSDIGVSVIVL